MNHREHSADVFFNHNSTVVYLQDRIPVVQPIQMRNIRLDVQPEENIKRLLLDGPDGQKLFTTFDLFYNQIQNVLCFLL